MIDITYGMTQEELIQQCLYVIRFPNENINYQELRQMYNKIEFERDEMGLVNMKSHTWLRTQPIRDKLKELEYYL